MNGLPSWGNPNDTAGEALEQRAEGEASLNHVGGPLSVQMSPNVIICTRRGVKSLRNQSAGGEPASRPQSDPRWPPSIAATGQRLRCGYENKCSKFSSPHFPACLSHSLASIGCFTFQQGVPPSKKCPLLHLPNNFFFTYVFMVFSYLFVGSKFHSMSFFLLFDLIPPLF